MNAKGLTLIETIVYFAIVGIVLIAVVSFSQRIISAKTKANTMQEVQQNTRISLEKLTQEIRSSNSIDTSDSTLGTNLVNGGFLHLDSGIAGEASDDVYILIDHNQLIIKTDPTAQMRILTNNYILVQNLTVTLLTDIGDHQSVKINYQTKYAAINDLPQYDWTVELEDTINIRKK